MSSRRVLWLVSVLTVAAAPAAPQTRTIAGVVVDRITGLPILAGEARLEASRERDRIRPDGVFVLQVPADRDVTVLFRVPAAGVPEGLAGKVVGAEVQSNSGTPGGAWSVRLRGISSLFLSSSPLYVVDGVLMSDESISSGVESVTGGQADATSRIVDLVAGDIESVEVLRGAAAASLYGSRGAGGVVVIRTKRGRVP